MQGMHPLLPLQRSHQDVLCIQVLKINSQYNHCLSSSQALCNYGNQQAVKTTTQFLQCRPSNRPYTCAWAIPGIVAVHAAIMQVTGINYQVPMKMSSRALF